MDAVLQISYPSLLHGLRAPHDGTSPYKRQTTPISPPLAVTRGYPYPQDPTRYPPSAHTAPSSIVYTTLYPSERHEFVRERYHESVPQPRRRPSLLPHADYVIMERERQLEQYRYIDREQVASGLPSHLLPSISGHYESEQVNKRPRLCMPDPKADLRQPLRIDTQDVIEIKREPAYNPQVEAISPTLPGDDMRPDSIPMRSSKDDLLQQISKVDREIAKAESQISKLKKKQAELEMVAANPETKDKNSEKSVSEPKHQSIAQVIYADNRKKVQEDRENLAKLGPKVELPLYNQPSDMAIYHENRRKFMAFKKNLIQLFKRRHRERQKHDVHLTDSYNTLYQQWLKKVDRIENSAKRKAKEAKMREFYEKQFPELKKQREDKERFSRVGTRIRSDAELEEIMDGLQEQELEDKKMRSYAVIPPILLHAKQRRLRFDNKNGLIEDPMAEHRDRQLLNLWTDQEKEIFKEKFLQHPKNFSLIAQYLDKKTVADCVQHYYLTKKGENYKQLLRKHNVRRKRFPKPHPQQPPTTNQSTGVTTRQGAANAQPDDSKSGNGNGGSHSGSGGNGSSGQSCRDGKESEKDGNGGNSNNKTDKDQKKEKDSETGDEQSDDNDGSNDNQDKSGGPHPCAVCKTMLEHFGQSRPVTKGNCAQYGLREEDVTDESRVCSSCRC
uniref:SANT domain-containing protein n=1 Tax=Strigamia maritima TaxID=126957 RepID=T1JIR2_STRMM